MTIEEIIEKHEGNALFTASNFRALSKTATQEEKVEAIRMDLRWLETHVSDTIHHTRVRLFKLLREHEKSNKPAQQPSP